MTFHNLDVLRDRREIAKITGHNDTNARTARVGDALHTMWADSWYYRPSYSAQTLRAIHANAVFNELVYTESITHFHMSDRRTIKVGLYGRGRSAVTVVTVQAPTKVERGGG